MSDKPFIYENLETIFPIKRNPLQDDPRIEQLYEQYFEFSGMSRDQYKTLWNVTEFSAWFHPFVTDLSTYMNSARKILSIFIFDDQDIGKDHNDSLQVWNQFDEMLDRLMLMVDTDKDKYISMVEWKPCVLLHYSIMENILQKYSCNQKRRFIELFRDYVVGNRKEVTLVASRHLVETMDELFEIRIDSAGVIYCFQMIEYLDDIELTDEEWSDPVMKEYMKYCTMVIILANDIASFDKEYEEYDFDINLMFNSVALVVRTENCSADAAKWIIAEQHRQLEHHAQDLRRQLLDRGGRDDYKRFVDLVQYVVGGTHKAGSIIYRYIKDK